MTSPGRKTAGEAVHRSHVVLMAIFRALGQLCAETLCQVAGGTSMLSSTGALTSPKRTLLCLSWQRRSARAALPSSSQGRHSLLLTDSRAEAETKDHCRGALRRFDALDTAFPFICSPSTKANSGKR